MHYMCIPTHFQTIINNLVCHLFHIYYHYFFIDIDECANSTLNLCEQRCINIPGDFMCACDTGFELTSNGMTCSGN